MNQRRARLLVAGLGRIGRLHAENLAHRIGCAELSGVADAVEPVAREIGERFGVPWWASFPDALRDPELDGVVIATPTALHPEMVEVAAAADKHVFCEKPLAFDKEASCRAVTAARAAAVTLQVGFQRRFDRDWIEMKRALDSGSLGELRLLRSSHRNAHEAVSSRELGGVFVDLAIHDFDAALWLGGAVAEVFALMSPGGGAGIALRFACGALGLIDVGRTVRYGFDCTAELVGSQASVRTGYQHRRGGLEWMRDGRASTDLTADHAERHGPAYIRELECFSELVLGVGRNDSPGEAGVAALELALAAERSAESGQTVRLDVDGTTATGATRAGP
jgi:predicted dehydrogenase